MSDIRLRVAHEALLTHWERAKTQIEKDEYLLKVRRRVETDMRLWEQSGKPTELLLPAGLKLIEAEKLSKEWEKELDVGIRNYIEASLNAEQERQRKEQETQDELKRRLVEANHNYGLALLEKAAQKYAQTNYNAAHIYAIHSLNNLKQDKESWLLVANSGSLFGAISVRHPWFDNREISITAVTLDGNILASSNYDAEENVILRDRTNGQQLHVLRHGDSVEKIAFSPDGFTLASGSSDGTICLWDVESGQKIQTLGGHEGRVENIVFSPNGEMLASCGIFKAYLWNYKQNTQPIMQFKHIQRIVIAAYNVLCIAFSPDGRILATGAEDYIIRLWNIASGEQLLELHGHMRPISSIAFHPDGKTLASGSKDYTTRMWSVKEGREVWKDSGQDILYGTTYDGICCVFFDQCGSKLVSNLGNVIRVWNLMDYQTELVLKIGHKEKRCYNLFMVNGDTITSKSSDINLWNVSSKKRFFIPNGNMGNINDIVFSPDGHTLVSHGNDKILRLWDVFSAKHLFVLEGHKKRITSVAFSRDNQLVASGSDDRTIRLWNPKNGRRISVLKVEQKHISSLAFSPNSNVLAWGGDDGYVHLWDVLSDKQLPVLGGYMQGSHNIAFNTDGRILAVGGTHAIRLWDYKNGQLLRVFLGHKAQIISIAFSPAGRVAASASFDGIVCLWDIESGKELWVIHELAENISFSHDGLILALANKEKICLLDVVSGGYLWVYEDNSSYYNTIGINEIDINKIEILSISFSPKRYTLAVGSNYNVITRSNDKLIRLFNFPDYFTSLYRTYREGLLSKRLPILEQQLGYTIDGLKLTNCPDRADLQIRSNRLYQFDEE